MKAFLEFPQVPHQVSQSLSLLFRHNILHPWNLAQGRNQFRAVMSGLVGEGHAMSFLRDSQGKRVWPLVLAGNTMHLPDDVAPVGRGRDLNHNVAWLRRLRD